MKCKRSCKVLCRTLSNVKKQKEPGFCWFKENLGDRFFIWSLRLVQARTEKPGICIIFLSNTLIIDYDFWRMCEVILSSPNDQQEVLESLSVTELPHILLYICFVWTQHAKFTMASHHQHQYLTISYCRHILMICLHCRRIDFMRTDQMQDSLSDLLGLHTIDDWVEHWWHH